MSAKAAVVPLFPASPTPGQRRTAAATRVRFKHGLYSSLAVVPGESEEAFQAFREEMILSLLPGTPVETVLAEQLVMLQWKLRRLWAAQTGVYRRHAVRHAPRRRTARKPPGLPEYLAACIHDDNTATGDLHRLSLEEQRLINLFLKVHRKYELNEEMRHKRLLRRDLWDREETEEYYPNREGHLTFRIREPRLNPDGTPNPAWTPPPPPPPYPTQAEPQLHATASSDGTSGEIADRGAGDKSAPLDPARMTPHQRALEAAEAEDDRWRAVVDRCMVANPPAPAGNGM